MKDLKTPKVTEFEEDFYSTLEALHVIKPELFPKDIDIREDYGIMRSTRRGVAAHALNVKIEPWIIKMMHRWSAERKSDRPSQTMLDTYARLDGVKPTLLRFTAPQ